MRSRSLLMGIGLAQSIDGSPMSAPAAADCHDVHIFLARGTSEPYPGRQGGLTEAVCDGLENCGYEDIIYRASGSPTYCASVEEGVAQGAAQIEAYAEGCPNAKLVLSGYSQGAQVLGDILGGAGGSFFGCTQVDSPPLDGNGVASKNIKAIMFFGNVRHVPDQPYNVGTAPNVGSGIYPRIDPSLDNLNNYSDKIQDYCLAGDGVCGGGDGDPNAHTSYFEIYTQEAADWIKGKL